MPTSLLALSSTQHRLSIGETRGPGISRHHPQFQSCSLTPVACLHSWEVLSSAVLWEAPAHTTAQMGHQYSRDTCITLAMPQASSYLVHPQAESKLGQAPPSYSFPWSSAALPYPAWGRGSCRAAIASPASTALKLLADCRQRNVAGVLAPNERDCLVKQNKKEVFLCLRLIS